MSNKNTNTTTIPTLLLGGFCVAQTVKTVITTITP